MNHNEKRNKTDIAAMVHLYLLEERLVEAANLFYKTSPYLVRSGLKHFVSPTPVQNLMDVLKDYISLRQNMVLLFVKYGKEINLSKISSPWEKVEYIINYYRTAYQNLVNSANAGNDSTAAGNEGVSQCTDRSSTITASKPQNIEPPVAAVYTPRQPNTVSASPLQVDHKKTPSLAVHSSNAQPVVSFVYENNESLPENLVPPVGHEVQVEMVEFDVQYHVPESHDIVTSTQETVVPVEPEQETEPIRDSNLPLPEDLQPSERENQMEVTSASDKPTEQQNPPVTPPDGNQKDVAEPAVTPNVADVSQSPSKRRVITRNMTQKTPVGKVVDEVALAEWKRIRSVNLSNFDHYVRKANCEVEQKERLEKLQKKQRAAVNAKAKIKVKQVATQRLAARPLKTTPNRVTKPTIKPRLRIANRSPVPKDVVGKGSKKRKEPSKPTTGLRGELSDSTDSPVSSDEYEAMVNDNRARKQINGKSPVTRSAKKRSKASEASPATEVTSNREMPSVTPLKESTAPETVQAPEVANTDAARISSTEAVAEEAIYAVLAKLHGH